MLSAFPAIASAQFNPQDVYEQSAAVRARYPDPPVQFDTPGFAATRSDFTSHDEMMQFVYGLEKASDNLQVRVLGSSQEGRAIPLLIFSNSGFASAVDLARLNRPVVLLVGLQHGDEPAGGEALLVLAQALAHGNLKPLLDHVTVIILPRANPDGAEHFVRSSYGTFDMNRDHVRVALPETQALHRAMTEFEPHVVVDAHEFSVAAGWLDKFGVLQARDVLLQSATNPNVVQSLARFAENVFLHGMRTEIQRAGYTHFPYYTTAEDREDRRVSMAGTRPDIGRNFAGLQNALSFLVETRGVGIGRQSYARRVHGHVIAMTSVLRTAADHAAAVLRVVQESRSEIVRRARNAARDNVVTVIVKPAATTRKLAMIDPDSGEPREIEVQWHDGTTARPELVRAWPYAYLMQPAFHEVAERLARSGVQVRRLRAAATLEVESYEVLRRHASPIYVEGRLVSKVTTEVKTRSVAFPAGSYVYLMSQPSANVIAVALEPESPSSFVTFGIIPVDQKGAPRAAAGSEVPIYRLLSPTALDMRLTR